MKLKIFILTGFIAFCGILKQSPLNYDDMTHLYDNPLTYNLSINTIPEIFSQAINDTYLPGTVLSWAIEEKIFGRSTVISKIINLGLHIWTAFLVYRLGVFLRFPDYGAFLGAIIFLIHPMRVESVTWLTERKDVLFAPFYLLSCLYYLKYRAEDNAKFYILALLFAAASILSKVMAISLPVALILFDWYHNRKFKIIDKIPFALIVIPVGLITWLGSKEVMTFSWPDGIFVWTQCFTEYIKRFIFPFEIFPLQTFYIHKWMILLFVGAALSLLYPSRKYRLMLFFYIITMFFLWRGEIKIHDTIADRFAYLPCVAFCWFIGDHLSRVKMKFLPVALILTLIIKTWTVIPVWNDSKTFYSSVLSWNPEQEKFYYQLGNMEYESENYQLASAYYSECLNHAGDIEIQDQCFLNRAKSFYFAGKKDYAYGDILRINQYAGTNDSIDWRGFLHLENGDYKSAIRDLQTAIRLSPDDGNNYYNLGIAYRKSGEKRLSDLNLTRAMDLSEGNDRKYYENKIVALLLKK